MKILKIMILLILSSNILLASTDYFNEGLILFKKNKFEKAKFKFEQDIVYNPKSEQSYLYLSKIFNKQNKKDLEEKNLNTVILLNPLNEEAIYSLAELKLNQSDFEGSNKLIDQLTGICHSYCLKSKELKAEIEKSLKK